MFVWVSCHWHPVDDYDDYDANDDNDEDSNEIGDTNDDGSNDKLIDQSKLVLTNVWLYQKAFVSGPQLVIISCIVMITSIFLLMMPILY